MRRGRVPSPEPAGRTAPTRSAGEIRMEQAEYGRDAKREQAMCSHGVCSSSHGLKEGPKGWRGQYGGSMLCEKHYRKVVDSLLASLIEHDCAPWEDAHPSNQEDDSTSDAGSGSQGSDTDSPSASENSLEDLFK